jgi:DNA-binding NarL/FixJ family response regulator
MSTTPSAKTSVGHENQRIAGPTPRDLDSTSTAQSMPPLKTYIVEDSQVIRENLIATLEELVPVEVVGTAEDEATAVQWLSRPGNQFDLVIVDIFLKGGSGLGVLRAAGGLPNGHAHRPKMVVLSNFATQDMRLKCLELGADRVFDKSNDIDALIQYCGRLADGGGTNNGALG